MGAATIALGKPAESGELILERRRRLASELSDILEKGGRLLDLGCGNGAQTELFVDRFEQVVGVDVQSEPMAGSNVPAQWVTAMGEALPFRDASFDAVISFEVLEHVVSPVRTMRELHRILKPGGTVLISVPNKWWV
ncbi:methyltransferase domain-containing protein, partial [bacterium]|nr:methyltransferase domain-containing protein [bacterium]